MKQNGVCVSACPASESRSPGRSRRSYELFRSCDYHFNQCHFPLSIADWLPDVDFRKWVLWAYRKTTDALPEGGGCRSAYLLADIREEYRIRALYRLFVVLGSVAETQPQPVEVVEVPH